MSSSSLSNTSRNRRALSASLLLGLGAVALGGTRAARAADETLEIPTEAPSYITDVIGPAHVFGAGIFKYFGFHMYDAFLWVPPEGFSADHPYDQPFALDITYARPFKGSAINQVTIDEWDRMELGTEEQRHQWFTELAPLTPDVVPGQKLTGFFSPTEGWKLDSNGKPIGQIKDVEMAKAYFAIWFDPRCKVPGLRKQLLALQTS